MTFTPTKLKHPPSHPFSIARKRMQNKVQSTTKLWLIDELITEFIQTDAGCLLFLLLVGWLAGCAVFSWCFSAVYSDRIAVHQLIKANITIIIIFQTFAALQRVNEKSIIQMFYSSFTSQINIYLGIIILTWGHFNSLLIQNLLALWENSFCVEFWMLK